MLRIRKGSDCSVLILIVVVLAFRAVAGEAVLQIGDPDDKVLVLVDDQLRDAAGARISITNLSRKKITATVEIENPHLRGLSGEVPSNSLTVQPRVLTVGETAPATIRLEPGAVIIPGQYASTFVVQGRIGKDLVVRSEEHTSELQ